MTNEWIEWKGGECPIDNNQLVEVRLRDGAMGVNRPENFCWLWNGADGEIVAYRLSGKNHINPDHYKLGGIEAIDYMKAKSTKEEFIGFLRLTAIKYLSRVGHKDEALQDYKKAQWYVNRIVEELSS